VHNLGRINFGQKLSAERKGILGGVFLGDEEVLGWEPCSIPCESLKQLRSLRPPLAAPVFYKGSFRLKETGDTYPDLRGWGLGAVWINGRNIGRFWHVGPQQTVFLPGARPKGQGQNEIVALDLLERPRRAVQELNELVCSKD